MYWLQTVTLVCTLSSEAFSAPQNVSDTVTENVSMEFHNESEQSGVNADYAYEKSTKANYDYAETIVNSAALRAEPQAINSESDNPVDLVTEATVTTKKPIQLPSKKPPRVQVPPAEPVTPSTTPSTTANPNRRYPCTCGGGLCSCCSGLILENFNVPIKAKACANITYEPDDFAFNFKLLFNNRVLYKTRMSAKNPRPVCIPINRYFGVKMCVKLSNIYMSGRNIHACLDMEGYWDDESAFKYSFNCFRIGSNGVGLVNPEDGGGLPPPPDEEEQTDEDYDDSARGWTGDVQVIPI